jgi:hypothetical protein
MPSQLADMVERVAEIRIRQDPTAINHNKEKVRGGVASTTTPRVP